MNRDDIKNGYIQKIAKEAETKGLIKLTSAEVREQSWRSMLASNPNSDGSVWVFAYGSLLWNPAFHFEKKIKATLHGFHRDFNLRTYVGRGCESQPGLVLGLEQGGECVGQVLKVQRDSIEEELDVLWSREMVSSAYSPGWYEVKTKLEQPVHAIVFVMDKNYQHYAGHLTFDERCHDLAKGQGALGCASDYLFETVRALEVAGISDALLEKYAAEVQRRLS